MRKLFTILYASMLIGSLPADASVSSIFSNIYENKVWGVNKEGEGTSGQGSQLENAKEYVAYLNGFLATHSCKSVVDIGCGNWELSKHINWDSIQYTGYDVVQKIISKNTALYGSSNIHFICDDGIYGETPEADLLICKDLLEHLPNDMISDFLYKLQDYKYCLITNDIKNDRINTPPNGDCAIGGYRPVDLTVAPFNLKATPVLTYRCADTTKQVLLVERK
jgi:SAM-dependent methyltransferase